MRALIVGMVVAGAAAVLLIVVEAGVPAAMLARFRVWRAER